jgi:hypothetical protein
VGEEKGVYRVLEGNLRKRDHLKEPSLDARMTLRWVFRKWDVAVWTGSG